LFAAQAISYKKYHSFKGKDMHISVMNKIAFLMASVIAAVTFSTEASALPLFARQTGMECAACHFQHFPMLTAFGRAFKSGAFSMVGAQEKVEGDNLSIPAVLNAAILTTAGYTKNDSQGSVAAGNPDGTKTPGDGEFYVPGTGGEFSLFVGGRTSANSGALAELGMVPSGGAAGGLSSAKIPMLWEVADGTRAGIVPFTTDGQGASYGFETLNTGANAVHTMLFIGGDANGSVGSTLSAQQYIGTGAAATGFALVLNNPGYFVNLTKFNQTGPTDAGSNAELGSTYARAAYIFDVAGWDSAVGVQSWSGSSFDGGDGIGTYATFTQTDTKATAIDGQMQNTLANGMPLGIYASYAKAPASTGTLSNAFNGGGADRSSFNISAELGVIPDKATVGFGIRRGKSGDTTITGSNASDNAILLEGSYKLAQNMLLNLVYTSQSGDYWNQANTDAIGAKQTTINLATIF
jgi:hypothetical protein